MKAIDTNVLARFVLGDDIAQQRHAVVLLSSGEPLYVPVTVALELAWVLSSSATIAMQNVGPAFGLLLSLPILHFEHRNALERAVGLVGRGIGFADALHLCSSQGEPESQHRCEALITFDVRFAKKARKSNLAVELLGG